MRSILTVIPARGGSKGINKKNIADLGGRPLISYVIEAARNSEYLGDVIVSTDDAKIAEIAREWKAEVPFIRPSEYAGDNVTLILVLRHALKHYDQLGIRYDAILSLQPTSPLVSSSTIDKVVKKFRDKQCDSVATISKIRVGHPYVSKRLIGADKDQVENFVVVPAGTVLYPRQRREAAYYFNGAMYLRRRELIEQFSGHSWGLGDSPRVVEMDAFESTDINETMDLQVAEVLLRSRAG